MSLKTFTNAYIECAFWSSTTEDGRPMDAIDNDPAPSTLAAFEADCARFYAMHGAEIEDDEQAGHDFWLTRNHHGAGFWDRGLGELGEKLTAASHDFGECELYVGDDRLIYAAGRENL